MDMILWCLSFFGLGDGEVDAIRFDPITSYHLSCTEKGKADGGVVGIVQLWMDNEMNKLPFFENSTYSSCVTGIGFLLILFGRWCYQLVKGGPGEY